MMKKRLDSGPFVVPRRGVLALLVAGLAACSSAEPGSGVARTEQRPLTPFTEIELVGVGTMIVTPGTTPAIEITTDDNLLPLFRTTVAQGKLVVRPERGVAPQVAPLFRVTAPEVRGLVSKGAADVTLDGVTGDTLRLEAIGAGKIVAIGQIDRLTVSVVGAGEVDALELAAKTGKVDVRGAGQVQLAVTDLLDVHLTGAGAVRYRGEPKKVTRSVVGAGEIEPLAGQNPK